MRSPLLSFRPACLLLAILGTLTTAAGRTLVYPLEAIPDYWQLDEKAFREKHGGIDLTGTGLSDQGWYVRYRHENLTLFFGPSPRRDDARRSMWELEAIRDTAARNRPTLTTSEIDLVRFD